MAYGALEKCSICKNGQLQQAFKKYICLNCSKNFDNPDRRPFLIPQDDKYKNFFSIKFKHQNKIFINTINEIDLTSEKVKLEKKNDFTVNKENHFKLSLNDLNINVVHSIELIYCWVLKLDVALFFFYKYFTNFQIENHQCDAWKVLRQEMVKHCMKKKKQ